jgi:putative tryptophan/tyrosine transport system substrate-binding protein
MKRRAFLATGAAYGVMPFNCASRPRSAASRTVIVLQSGDDEGLEHVRRLRETAAGMGLELRFGVRFSHLPVKLDDPRLAEHLRQRVRELPIAIIADSEHMARAASLAVPNTPIVFFMNDDPIRTGLVATLRRPGGWLTGVTTHLPLHLKHSELLIALAPRTQRAALITTTTYAIENDLADITHQVWQQHGVEWMPAVANDPRELASVLTRVAHQVDGFVVPLHWLSFAFPTETVRLIARCRKPAVYGDVTSVARGGLLAYYARFSNVERAQLSLLESVLSGVRPGEIPVLRPNRFELAINVETAARGPISLPKSVLKRATHLLSDGTG